MALTGWNKVIERNGNVYYHNKHTGVMRFSPPPVIPDNVPLKRATKMASFTKLRERNGRLLRGYHLGNGYYVAAKRFEGNKFITVSKYIELPDCKEPCPGVRPAIALDEDIWEELCKYKNIVTELASHYDVSVKDGTARAEVSHPEKFRLVLGKGKYIRILVKYGKVFVDIRHFNNVLQLCTQKNGERVIDPALPVLEDKEGDRVQQGVSPDHSAVELPFEQWKNMTSLEGLIAAEHLKSLINIPLCPRKRTQSLPPSAESKRRKVDLKLKLDLAPVKEEEAKDEKETKPKVSDVARKRTQTSPPSESLTKRHKVDLKLNLAP